MGNRLAFNWGRPRKSYPMGTVMASTFAVGRKTEIEGRKTETEIEGQKNRETEQRGRTDRLQ